MAVTRRTLWLLRALRLQVGDQADRAVRELTGAWVAAWDTLDAAWQQAIAELVDLVAETGTWPAPWRMARLERLTAAHLATAQALAALTTATGQTAGGAAAETVAATAAAEPAIMASQLPPALAAAALKTYAANIAPSALEAIVARSRQQITSTAWPISDEATEAIRRALIVGVAVGENPRDTARSMVRQVEGAFNGGLARATNIARTEVLDAYRHTSAAVHAANADVLDGWQWVSTLDRRTCFPAGTWITTRTGQVPIEAVRVGDEVLTHAGCWRRVYETLNQEYAGPMVTVEAGPLRVTATADHPFLIERQGELQWVEAQDIRRGDRVLSDRESDPHSVDHAGGESAIERGGDQAHDGPAEALHVQSLAGVAVGDLGVPVRLVNLDGGPAVDEEVDRALPAGHDGLLLVGDAERVKSATDIAFGHGLAGVTPVAAHRAKAGVAQAGNDAKMLPAGDAADRDGRSAADLRTVGAVCAAHSEDRSAAGAGSVCGVGSGALDRAVVVPVGVAARDAERLAAPHTDLGDLGGAGVAGPRAVGAGLPPAGAEDGAAGPALSLDARYCCGAAAVGVFPLVGGVAGPAAELSPALPIPRGGDAVRDAALGAGLLDFGAREMGAVVIGAAPRAVFEPPVPSVELGPAVLTTEFNRHVVSNVVTHVQATRVYNVEVEIDHTYVANGFVVHNCPSCWGMHGTVWPLSQPGPWDHHSGRCARLPKVRSWEELGIPGVEGEDLTPNAAERFAALPPADQAAIMGPGRLALLNSGQIGLADLAMRRDNPGWRPSYAARPVRDLRRIAERRRVA